MPLVASQCCDRLKVKKTKKGKMNEIISRHFSTDQFCAVGVAQKLAVAFTQLQRAEQTEQTIARDGARLEERQKRRRNSTSSLVSKRKKETKKKKRTERRIGGDADDPGPSGTRTSEAISRDKRRDQKAEVNTRCAIVSRTCGSVVGWDRERERERGEREKSG